ncbi:carboxymuconolactone decarboxylase family protein [Tenggerimyces flavus]|uniref:Carboxymuconolactone decarboxylase family protein n=1 Tax=Tenggerimyces flavus TaxID=1708749 RepID=A0ABV7YLL8_9ACTN|nr:carboxymuconolactone decarboxylase family protein [Tenggerimyces flavus]MBM7787791.1 AhpD family alkylhydroperoxidase [Tenggerimyces flavus]
MTARMKNPVAFIPDALPGINTIVKATRKGVVAPAILELVHLRASQINGCSFCVDTGTKSASQAGVTAERLFAVAAWRDAPYFSDEERAALALAESVTRLSDRSDPVPDEVWNEAADHFDENQLATLILWISLTNFYNRLNVTVKQPVGGGW